MIIIKYFIDSPHKNSLYINMSKNTIKVVELFAGVGGFRIGLEGASDAYETIWNNQWEPSTKHQDASLVYTARFGSKGHSNQDINTVPTADIPDHDLLVGGFPCQDYSVASTLSRSGGIEGKKGVLWWQIYRILNEKGDNRPSYIFFENVDRLLGSPAKQRGRDFAIILASLADLGYMVEWRVINAAEYGMPQRRRRTYIVGYRENSNVSRQVQELKDWVLYEGVLAKAFPFKPKDKTLSEFEIKGTIKEVSDNFNKEGKDSPFGNAGIMRNRCVYSVDAEAVYDGPVMTLGGNIVDESLVPEEFFIPQDEVARWEYEKGAKKIERTTKEGFKYLFSEGGMAFPDSLDKPSRTIIIGEAIGTFYGFKWAGVEKNDKGQYVDMYYAADGTKTASPNAGTDRFVLGRSNPDVTLGWNNTITYKNWDFNMFCNAAFGAKRLNIVRFAMNAEVGASRFVTDKDHFSNIGVTMPTIGAENKNYGNSDKWLENADYFRCENISVAYTFPRSVTKLADIRLSLSAQNLFTITGYKGIDPAGASFSDANVDRDNGLDMGAYPNPRTITMGVRVTF